MVVAPKEDRLKGHRWDEMGRDEMRWDASPLRVCLLLLLLLLRPLRLGTIPSRAIGALCMMDVQGIVK